MLDELLEQAAVDKSLKHHQDQDQVSKEGMKRHCLLNSDSSSDTTMHSLRQNLLSDGR